MQVVGGNNNGDLFLRHVFHQKLFGQAPLGGIEPVKGFIQQQNIRMGGHTQHKFCLPLHPFGEAIDAFGRIQAEYLGQVLKRFIAEFRVVALIKPCHLFHARIGLKIEIIRHIKQALLHPRIVKNVFSVDAHLALLRLIYAGNGF